MVQQSGGIRLEYADHQDAFGDLWLPDGSEAAPVVVLIHGGFWRDGYALDLMNPLVGSLLLEQMAVWNIEYRRVGAGGGYSETFDDVASAIDFLADLPPDLARRVDLDRVAVVGHSAGGHLAVWSAGRSELPAGVAGADPIVVPTLAISQAGVLDLIACADENIGGTACPDLLGASPMSDPERYAVSSPTEMVPIGVEVVAVHGSADDIVPTSQSRRYVERAEAAGDPAQYIEIPGADHFDNLDPAGQAWAAVLDALRHRL